MKFFKDYILPFGVLFVVMLVDGHLSNLLTTLFSTDIHLLSHLLLIFVLYISINLSENTNFIILLLIGLLYDIYYFHIIGLSTLLLPLMGIVVSKYNSLRRLRLLWQLWLIWLECLLQILLFIQLHQRWC